MMNDGEPDWDLDEDERERYKEEQEEEENLETGVWKCHANTLFLSMQTFR